jgi:hypothetical protein
VTAADQHKRLTAPSTIVLILRHAAATTSATQGPDNRRKNTSLGQTAVVVVKLTVRLRAGAGTEFGHAHVHLTGSVRLHVRRCGHTCV